MKRTLEAIRQATSTGKVDLVSVRLSLPPRNTGDDEDDNESSPSDDDYHREVLERARVLTEQLVTLSSEQQETDDSSSSSDSSSFKVVCSSDLVSVAVRARAHGVHVKEHHLDRLPGIVAQFDYPVVVGTSTHSVESALGSYFGGGGDNDSATIQPHYYFVGTCYLTASHPEKTRQDQLEGPELPGTVQRALSEQLKSKSRPNATEPNEEDGSKPPSRVPPRILAIGGIDETNCYDPVAMGADGVAVIRAVLQADRPFEKVEEMQGSMARAMEANNNNNN